MSIPLIERQRNFEEQRRINRQNRSQRHNMFIDDLSINNGQIMNQPITENDIVNKSYVDSTITQYVKKSTAIQVDELNSSVVELKAQVAELQKFKDRYEDLCEFLLAQNDWLDRQKQLKK